MRGREENRKGTTLLTGGAGAWGRGETGPLVSTGSSTGRGLPAPTARRRLEVTERLRTPVSSSGVRGPTSSCHVTWVLVRSRG